MLLLFLPQHEGPPVARLVGGGSLPRALYPLFSFRFALLPFRPSLSPFHTIPPSVSYPLAALPLRGFGHSPSAKRIFS